MKRVSNNHAEKAKLFGISEMHNISNHFLELSKNVKEVLFTNHFKKDIKGMTFNPLEITSPEHLFFIREHKFEEKIHNCYIFRAIHEKKHIVYAINNDKLIFLRAFKNFKEYCKFLEDKKEIEKLAGLRA